MVHEHLVACICLQNGIMMPGLTNYSMSILRSGALPSLPSTWWEGIRCQLKNNVAYI